MTQIFVGGLNKTSDVPAITSYFSTFGTVSEVKIVAGMNHPATPCHACMIGNE